MLALLSTVGSLAEFPQAATVRLPALAAVMFGWVFLAAGIGRGTFLVLRISSRRLLLALAVVGILGGGYALSRIQQPEEYSRTQVEAEMRKLAAVMDRLNQAADIANAAAARGMKGEEVINPMLTEFHLAHEAGKGIQPAVLVQADPRLPALLKYVLPRLEKCNPSRPVPGPDFLDCQAAANEFGEGLEKVRRESAGPR